MNKKQKNLLWRIILATALVIVLKIVDDSLPGWQVRLALYLVPYLIVGHDILRKAFKGIKNGQVFDENFLMTVATLGALGIGIYNGIAGNEEDYLEAVAVMLLYQLGEFFQGVAVGRSRKNISELMDIRPDYANLVTDYETGGSNSESTRVDPDEVEVGSVIVVNPGEKIPIDGEVIEGRSSLNTAALTGESVPRTVNVGDSVLSGCVNNEGVLYIRTGAEFDESTASKILDLVENAASRKSKSENFISKFAKYYTPIVCYLALALAVIPPVFLGIMGYGFGFATWIYRACTFLVISCPCAVVISIPLSFFAGLGGASREGILIKGSNFLETLSKVNIVAFDKTGTLTKGDFKVSKIVLSGNVADLNEAELIRYAASVESHSSHPIAKSIMEECKEELYPISNVTEHSGEGVISGVNGKTVGCGNGRLLKRIGINGQPEIGANPAESIGANVAEEAGTVVNVTVDGVFAGYIVISDTIKPGAKEAMDRLKRIGVKRRVMLTGDSEKVAKNVAYTLGISEYHAELMPKDKVDLVEKLLLEKAPNDKLAFVGDGINDAPVLTRADIGIAMGALGSDAAIEAADIVLMDDDPGKISKAIGISAKCMGIVKQNIIFSLGVKGICLVLGALGFANMWVAVFADVGVMIIAVGNAIRCLFVRKI